MPAASIPEAQPPHFQKAAHFPDEKLGTFRKLFGRSGRLVSYHGHFAVRHQKSRQQADQAGHARVASAGPRLPARRPASPARAAGRRQCAGGCPGRGHLQQPHRAVRGRDQGQFHAAGRRAGGLAGESRIRGQHKADGDGAVPEREGPAPAAGERGQRNRPERELRHPRQLVHSLAIRRAQSLPRVAPHHESFQRRHWPGPPDTHCRLQGRRRTWTCS